MYSGVTRATVVVVVTRRMKSSAARIMPASTATVRSANTVSAKVMPQTAASAGASLRTPGTSRHSPMSYATTSRIAARIASGI